MRRRQLVIIPLLVASIIMLMTTVMPHHHHGTLICFTASHCVQYENQNCDHDHDTNSAEKGCEVKQLFETAVIKEHHNECSCCTSLNPDQSFLTLFIFAGEYYLSLFTGESQILSPTPYRERLHPITWSLISAGRAPPIVIA